MLNKILNKNIQFTSIVLPIGISFFTFQGLSYVVDVYRGDVEHQTNLSKLALYITLFPQLIAGPIVRYTTIEKEISNRKIELEDIVYGIKRFSLGLFKKVAIANSMAVIVDSIWADLNITVATAWLGLICYALQIFFDFSGYSDMAIGLGRLLGFHFMENFNFPYISRSISEFWRRWHISLSSWFRDYVYIPLGGNRKHQYLNLSIVFLLTGIWHGASTTFIIWGIWHGIFILLEKFMFKKIKNKTFANKKMINILLNIYTLSVVSIGWIFFRAPSLTTAIKYIKILFAITISSTPGFNVMWYLDKYTVFVIIIGLIFSTPIIDFVWSKASNKISDNSGLLLTNAITLLLFLYSVIRIVSGTYNPFIYFQF